MNKKKEWSLDDFDKPKGKGVLKRKYTKKPPGELKNAVIQVWVTHDEKKQIEQLAEDNGMSATAFVRFQLRQIQKRK